MHVVLVCLSSRVPFRAAATIAACLEALARAKSDACLRGTSGTPSPTNPLTSRCPSSAHSSQRSLHVAGRAVARTARPVPDPRDRSAAASTRSSTEQHGQPPGDCSAQLAPEIAPVPPGAGRCISRSWRFMRWGWTGTWSYEFVFASAALLPEATGSGSRRAAARPRGTFSRYSCTSTSTSTSACYS